MPGSDLQLAIPDESVGHGNAPAPETAAPLPARIPALDGVRGVAILVVMVSHLRTVFRDQSCPALAQAVLFAGWTGVDLFFVLSGFLITGILFDAKGGAGYFRNFYARRTIRIFPLYYVALAVIFWVAPAVAPESAPGDWLSVAMSAGPLRFLGKVSCALYVFHPYYLCPACARFRARRRDPLLSGVCLASAPFQRGQRPWLPLAGSGWGGIHRISRWSIGGCRCAFVVCARSAVSPLASAFSLREEDCRRRAWGITPELRVDRPRPTSGPSCRLYGGLCVRRRAWRGAGRTEAPGRGAG